MKLKLQACDAPPKGARIFKYSGGPEEDAFWREFDTLLVEFVDAGADWAEVDGWQPLFRSAVRAADAMRYRNRPGPNLPPSPVRIHRVGSVIYIRRAFDEWGEI